MTRFLTEYNKADGSLWRGPDIWADSFEDAIHICDSRNVQKDRSDRIAGEYVGEVDASTTFTVESAQILVEQLQEQEEWEQQMVQRMEDSFLDDR